MLIALRYLQLQKVPRIYAVALILAAIVVAAYVLGLHRFVPILGFWEHFQFQYEFGAVNAHLSWRIAPRANLGGQGYALLDLGQYITEVIGFSINGFRLIVIVYSLITIGALIVVFSRWFGLAAAALGAVIAVTSTGFIIFANAMLVVIPTLMLCVLLVERFQVYEASPHAIPPKIMIGMIGALLVSHYSMGRYFFAGWLTYYFVKNIIVAWYAFPSVQILRKYASAQLSDLLLIGLITVLTLTILSPMNFVDLLFPIEVFFPQNADEIELKAGKLLQTIIQNIVTLAHLVFSFSGGHSPDDLSNTIASNHAVVAPSPLLNVWHLPFLAFGVIISLRRTFLESMPGLYPYISLHVIFLLTTGLVLFSERYFLPVEGVFQLYPINRNVGSFFAISGYVIAGIAWALEVALKRGEWWRNVVMGCCLAVIVAGALSLSNEANSWRVRISDMGKVDLASGKFEKMPEPTTLFGLVPHTYSQARYYNLATLISRKLKCSHQDSGGTVLLRLSPVLLLDSNGKYPVPQYTNDYNDLSAVLSLYLGDRGVNAAYIIAHGKDDPGHVSPGEGYAGPRRIFSGPIGWENGEIVYLVRGPLAYHLKGVSRASKADVVIVFSDVEAQGAREVFANAKAKLIELAPVTNLIEYFEDNECSKLSP